MIYLSVPRLEFKDFYALTCVQDPFPAVGPRIPVYPNHGSHRTQTNSHGMVRKKDMNPWWRNFPQSWWSVVWGKSIFLLPCQSQTGAADLLQCNRLILTSGPVTLALDFLSLAGIMRGIKTEMFWTFSWVWVKDTAQKLLAMSQLPS